MVIQVKPFFFWYKHTYHTVSKTQKRSVVMIRMKNTLQYHRWRIHSLILAQEFSINLKFHIKGTEYLAIIKRSKPTIGSVHVKVREESTGQNMCEIIS